MSVDVLSRLRRMLVGDAGWVAALSTLLFIVVGAGLVFVGVGDLTEAVRTKPVPMSCSDFLRADQLEARWVSLSGCRLDLSSAATRRWSGWLPTRDGGSRSGKTLEIFIPLWSTQSPARSGSGAVLATTEKRLLGLIDDLSALETPEKVEAFLAEHEEELASTLAPEALVGYVEPIASTASRHALTEIGLSGARVLEQGREPQRTSAFCSVLAGLGLLVWGLIPLARRFRLEDES